jgi:hypothetical protein
MLPGAARPASSPSVVIALTMDTEGSNQRARDYFTSNRVIPCSDRVERCIGQFV